MSAGGRQRGKQQGPLLVWCSALPYLLHLWPGSKAGLQATAMHVALYAVHCFETAAPLPGVRCSVQSDRRNMVLPASSG